MAAGRHFLRGTRGIRGSVFAGVAVPTEALASPAEGRGARHVAPSRCALLLRRAVAGRLCEVQAGRAAGELGGKFEGDQREIDAVLCARVAAQGWAAEDLCSGQPIEHKVKVGVLNL